MEGVTHSIVDGGLIVQIWWGQVDARIYLWKWDTRVVISDVDGTITKYVWLLTTLLRSI